MTRILRSAFFGRRAVQVASELLGKYLVREWRGKEIISMITEVEAYDGPRDKASHASKGKTPRTKIMFGPPGRWYVYFTYGMHWMLNIVTGREEYPAAVLIRGVEGVSGPGRITKFFKITKQLNGEPAHPRAGLWIEDRGIKIPHSRIKRGFRIGVEYAGPVWAKKEYRFLIRSSAD